MTRTLETTINSLEAYCQILEALADSPFDASEAMLLVTRGIRNTRNAIRKEASTWIRSTGSIR